MVACGFKEKEPQIKALSVVPLEGAVHHKVCYRPWFIKEPEKNNELKRTETNSGSVSSYGVRTSSLLIFFIFGRIYRKAQQHFGTRMTRIGRIFTDTANLRTSASSAQSVFHHVCSSLKTPASGASVSAFIRVYLRFFIDVIFQTGLTGSTGYVFDPVHPVRIYYILARTIKHSCTYIKSRSRG